MTKLQKYKLNYEYLENEKKIWRASTAKNKAQRTLHHRVQLREIPRLLLERQFNKRTDEETKGDK